MICRRTSLRHRFTACIALVAMVFAALMPTLSRAQGDASLRHIEVCSVFGMKSVQVSADELPAAPQKPAHQVPCPVCAMAGSALLPSPALQIFFSALQAAAPPVGRDVVPPFLACLPPASRGPPLVA